MKKKVLVLVAITIIVSAFIFIIIPAMGYFLVVDDELETADAIIVLMGSIADRALEAADLYHSGYAEELLIGNEFNEGIDLLEARGVSIPTSAELFSYVMVELGIPAEAIKVLPREAMSTLDEAHIVGDYLKKRPDINSVILVTSSYHTRRTKLTFEQVFRELDLEVKILSRASRYSLFQSERWWSDRESAKQVVQEYQKLAYFWFWERFRRK